MGRASLQGEPWHYEYLSSGKNSYNCIFCDREYGNKCGFKKSIYYSQDCAGKKNCDFYQSMYVSSARKSSATQRRSVNTWGDYFLKTHDYESWQYFWDNDPEYLKKSVPPEMKVLVNTNRAVCKYLKDGKCGKNVMSYYAKDCLFMFFIGLIPSMFFKQGVVCWAVICLARYWWIKDDWKKYDEQCCKTKEEFHAKGYYPPDNWFDEEGNYIGGESKHK